MIDFQSILFVNLTVFSDLSFWKSTPIFLKYYSFLMCKPFRSVSPKLFSPPFLKLLVLLEGNAVCVPVSFFSKLFSSNPRGFNINHADDPKSHADFSSLSQLLDFSLYLNFSLFQAKLMSFSWPVPHLTSLHNSLKWLTDGCFVMEQHSLSHTQHCFSSAWQQ